jgi:hypothetical protein
LAQEVPVALGEIHVPVRDHEVESGDRAEKCTWASVKVGRIHLKGLRNQKQGIMIHLQVDVPSDITSHMTCT